MSRNHRSFLDDDNNMFSFNYISDYNNQMNHRDDDIDRNNHKNVNDNTRKAYYDPVENFSRNKNDATHQDDITHRYNVHNNVKNNINNNPSNDNNDNNLFVAFKNDYNYNNSKNISLNYNDNDLILNASYINCTTINSTNIETDDNVDFENFHYWVSIIVPVLFGFISIVGFVGNLMVIVSVIANRQMRHTTNLLIIHLAIADLLFIVFCVPFTAVSYAIPWPFGRVWCQIYQYMILVTAITSVYTLVLMSLDRFLAVCYPIQSIHIRTQRNTLIAIWLLTGIIMASLLPVVENFSVVNFSSLMCLDTRMRLDLDYAKTFHLCFFILGYAIPLGLVCLLYGLMLRRLVHGGNAKSGRIRKSNNDSKKRVTRLVVVVVSVFALCWLPVHVIFLVQSFSRQQKNDEDEELPIVSIKIAFQCLAYLNSCVNPVLYAFLSEQFRKSFMRFFGNCCPQHELIRPQQSKKKQSEKQAERTVLQIGDGKKNDAMQMNDLNNANNVSNENNGNKNVMAGSTETLLKDQEKLLEKNEKVEVVGALNSEPALEGAVDNNVVAVAVADDENNIEKEI